MNKYLKTFNKIIDILKNEENTELESSGYSLLWKTLIANELDCCWSEEELTAEQEEWLIESIYEFYMSVDYSSIGGITNAYIRTINNLGGIKNLMELENNNPAELRDKIIWNIED